MSSRSVASATTVSRVAASSDPGPAGLSAPVELVRLSPLMARTSGRPDVVIGLLDGPVATNHPDLQDALIREVPGRLPGICARPSSAACLHGTSVAGILCARRGSAAPAICPGCTLLVRPIFGEETQAIGPPPSATPEELAAAILDCIEQGARVLNLSVGLTQPSIANAPTLDEALSHAMRRGTLVVVAAGNQGTLGSSVITRHPWVIPVAACDLQGRPISQSNLGSVIGRRGLLAPGAGVTSLAALDGGVVASGGTSAAAAFVTGAAALLWSLVPAASAAEIKLALIRGRVSRRTSVVPPLLDCRGAYDVLTSIRVSGRVV